MDDSARLRRRSLRWTLVTAGWIVAVPLALAIVRLVSPSDGLSVDPTGGSLRNGLTIDHVSDGSPLRVGDVVLAINGHSVSDLATSPRSRPVHAGDTLVYRVQRGAHVQDIRVTIANHAWRLPRLTAEIPAIVFFAVLLGLAVRLVRRRPGERAAHVLLLLGVVLASGLFDPLTFFEPLDLWARPPLVGWTIATWPTFMELGLSALLLALAFPGPPGWFLRRSWIASALVPPAALAALGIVQASGYGSLGLIHFAGWTLAGTFFGCTLGAAVVIAGVRWFQLRREPLFRRRAQIAVLGVVPTIAMLVGFNTLGNIPDVLYLPVLAIFPLSLGVAVAKREWFELDLALSRGLVALVCGSILLAIYLGIALLTARVASTGNTLSALPAAGVVAVSFAPLRWRVQRLIDQRLFGTGEDPRLVFHRLGVRLAASDDPESLMAAVVDTATESLRLSFAAVELRTHDRWRTVEERGTRPAITEAFDVVAGDSVVGRLTVAPRRGTQTLSPTDRELLADLARHSGVAARVAGLMAELRTAQQRALVAREAERDRIHRDLHDGVGPSLIGLTLQLEVAAEIAAGGQLGSIISRLHDEAARATDDVRRMVRDLRPADLEELGLPAAIAATAARLGAPTGPRFDLDCPIRLPDLSRQVEDAAYKICLEAMSNALRHSGASRCAVRLRSTAGKRGLLLEIADDGIGMQDAKRQGTGLVSMRARAEAVGGELHIETHPGRGTRIRAELPTVTDIGELAPS
jgi:two-component system, NarL family, sensor kinase